MNKLVQIRKIKGIEDVFTDSKIIADKTEYKHNSITKILRRYKNDFEEFGPLDTMSVGKNGTSNYLKLYLLNEQQATLLMTYLENNLIVRKFKIELVREFFLMRQFLREKQSSGWKETRIKGKLCRRNETDVIMTKLIPLAVSQGSENAGKLYMTYSKLVNKCVGIPAKSREKATKRVLDVIYNLENLIEHVISEEVDKGTYYKDIYQICKGKCNLMIELSYLPEQRLIA